MAAYFTGRERFALTLAGAVLRSRVTVMYGQSGCGKSSVLGAAFPQVLRATLHDAEEAASDVPLRLLNFRRWHPGFETRLFHAAAAKLAAPKNSSLASAVAAWGQDRKAPVILVLDQFEEFLLYHPKPAETSFVRDLATVVADPDNEAHVLLSLREDSLASLDALRAVIPGILASPVQLRPLDRNAAEHAIRRPVAKWSEGRFGDPKTVVVEDSLVETLLDQVRQTGTGSSSAGPVPNGALSFVELPMLQLALERLWEREAEAEIPVMRLRTLEQFGGAEGIAQRHLDKTLDALPALRRALAIRLFGHLVTPTGGKQAWRADDLAEEIDSHRLAELQAAERSILGRFTARLGRVAAMMGAVGRSLSGARPKSTRAETSRGAVSEALDELAQGKARILRTQPDPRGRGPLFELYHDALARPVLSWVQEARVNEAVGRLRRGAAYAVGAALLMLAGIVVVYTFYHRAVIQQARAQLQEARAVSTLARQATERGDAMTGMLAALAVLPKDLARPDRPRSNAASGALLDAWLRNHEKYDLFGHSDLVSSVGFSPDGKRVVTGSDDKTTRVWDLSGATPAATVLEGHEGKITSVGFSPDGKRVVTGSDDKTARVWDLSGATPAATVLEGHEGKITSAAFSPDGKRVVTGSDEKTARVWDLSGATPSARVLEGHEGEITSAAFSPDGRRVVTGSVDKTARLWDLSGVTPVATVLEGHRRAVESVAFSPDGERLVTGSDDFTARVWDLSEATPAATVLNCLGGAVLRVKFSPDGKRVVTGSFGGTAQVWDLSGPTPAATVLEGHRSGVLSVAFSPDGKRVVTGSADNTARVWDLSGTTLVAIVLEGHRGGVTSVAFSPDGKRVVTGSWDKTARVWDLSGATPAATVLEGHRSGVWSVAFSPDGKRVVTGSADNTARVWDLSGTTPVATVLEGHLRAVWSVAFSPDGKRVVTGSWDNTARVWDTPRIEELIPLARAALTRCLTTAQRDALGLPILPGAGKDRERVDPPPCS
jgi:WD40 repeat protein